MLLYALVVTPFDATRNDLLLVTLQYAVKQQRADAAGVDQGSYGAYAGAYMVNYPCSTTIEQSAMARRTE